MQYGRFNFIIQFNVFEVPNGERKEIGPLHQIRSYLDAFNDTLAITMEPDDTSVLMKA
jgi:hypothetical protein